MSIPANQITPIYPVENFRCQIGHLFMRHPRGAVGKDGKVCHIFEKMLIVIELEKNNHLCPVCHRQIVKLEKIPTLNIQIDEYRRAHPELDDSKEYKTQSHDNKSSFKQIIQAKKRIFWRNLAIITVIVAAATVGTVIAVHNQ